MLVTIFDLDGVTAVEILVKTAAYAACLVAAGSATALLALSRLDGETAQAVRRLAVASAAIAAAASALRIPVRASFLMGGSFGGAFDPAIVGMVVESPLGVSLWIRLVGLALVCLAVVNRPAARFAAGLGAVLVCASFSFRGHTLEEPRLVLGALVTLHLMGLAFWVGALAPLHRLARTDEKAAGSLAAEFGARAVWIVPGLVAAGAALFVLLTGGPVAALDTTYGQVLAVKLCLFALLLGLAALNKLLLTPALQSGARGAGSRLRRSIRLEIIAVLAILATTATLTTVASPEPPDHDGVQQADASNLELVAVGATVYGKHCASCHGKNLEGEPDWRRRRLDGTLPAPPHDATGHTWHHSDDQLFRLTKEGPGAVVGKGYRSTMPGFAGTLEDHEIWASLAYIKSRWPPEIREIQARRNEDAR